MKEFPKAENFTQWKTNIVDGHFQYDGSHLIGTEAECTHAGLTTLAGCPHRFEKSFFCYNNKLSNLVGGPAFIGRTFAVGHNKLTSPEGCASNISADLELDNNQISSLEGAPLYVGRTVVLRNNKLTNLHNVHNHFKYIGSILDVSANPIKSHILGLLKIDGLQRVSFDKQIPKQIINKYLRGSRDILDCQEELIEAGYEEYAQL